MQPVRRAIRGVAVEVEVETDAARPVDSRLGVGEVPVVQDRDHVAVVIRVLDQNRVPLRELPRFQDFKARDPSGQQGHPLAHSHSAHGGGSTDAVVGTQHVCGIYLEDTLHHDDEVVVRELFVDDRDPSDVTPVPSLGVGG
jgi:hypothetical protein